LREHQTERDDALGGRLELAEQALALSNQNIHLTISIFLTQGAKDIAPLMAQRVENSAKISALVHKIREQSGSGPDKKVLDAAGVQWSWPYDYHRLPDPLPVVTGRIPVRAETAMLNVMLPLLLDNHSWKVAVEFLRAQTELPEASGECQQQMAEWLGELVSTNQRLKTKVIELERIEELLSQFASIIEFSSDAIVIHSLDGTIVSWNKGAENIYGYEACEVVGRSRQQLLPDGQEDELPGIAEGLKRGDGIRLNESVHVCKDRRRIDVSTTMSPVKDARGKIVGAVAITRDITDRKTLEAQLRQAQRMECVGRLSGGVAHDFNNILGVIIGYSGVLEESMDGVDGPVRKSVQEIKKAGHRAAVLTRQLLAFSRQQVLEAKVLNLNSVVADMSKMLYRLIGEHIELNTSLEPELKQVRADKGQIEQIIMNLAINARDAMSSGGNLSIETANVEVGESSIQNAIPKPGRYVLLSVIDTGVGMEKETLSHIFEPFFTTKGEDKGTGLGLSVVYGVVKQSGGYITVDSAPGEGSTFKIYLPLVEEVVEPEARPTLRIEPHKGSGTILLVEDEDALRALTAGLLAQIGYTVLETSNGAQALEIGREQGESIDLLLTDVVLPGMSGIELAENLSKSFPDIKILFMSGYTHYATGGRRALDPGAFLLQKPFSPDELRSKVREVLDTDIWSKV
jgi:PAS domain S-box-containing protein